MAIDVDIPNRAGPFYIEVWGEAAMGKTHQTHSNSIDPVHFDTASSSMDFGDFNIDVPETRRGESWDVIHAKVHDWDSDEADRRYRFIGSFEEAKEHLSELPDDEFETVIIDNWYDFRTLIVAHVVEEYPNLSQSRGWPTDDGWGKVNDLYREFAEAVLESGRHLIIISEMQDEYVEGEKTGGRVRKGPKRAQFDCDFRIKLESQEREDTRQPKRRAVIKKNRWLDRHSDEWVPELGTEFDMRDLLHISGIPEDYW